MIGADTLSFSCRSARQTVKSLVDAGDPAAAARHALDALDHIDRQLIEAARRPMARGSHDVTGPVPGVVRP